MTQTFPEFPGDEPAAENPDTTEVPVAVVDDGDDGDLADAPVASDGEDVVAFQEEDEEEFHLRRPQDPNETQDIRFIPDVLNNDLPEGDEDSGEVVDSDDDTADDTSDSNPDVDDSV